MLLLIISVPIFKYIFLFISSTSLAAVNKKGRWQNDRRLPLSATLFSPEGDRSPKKVCVCFFAPIKKHDLIFFLNPFLSTEEDSKTTAKDLESHEEATLPKETSSKETTKHTPKTNASTTRIPTKLAPLKKLDKLEGVRRKDSSSQDRQHSRRDSDSKMENPLATDRASRDYTNLRFVRVNPFIRIFV